MNNIVFTREASAELRNKLESVSASDVFVLVDNNSRNYCMERLNMGYVPGEHVITIAEDRKSTRLNSSH